MSTYDDRHAVHEALMTDGLLTLCQESRAGKYDHKPPAGFEDILDNPGLHQVRSRWLRNVSGGQRVPAFYGLEVWPSTCEQTDYSAEHKRDMRVDIEDNKWSTKNVGFGSERFECDIELFHEVVTHCVTVYPTIDHMSERAQRNNMKEYEERCATVRQHNLISPGLHDPYTMHIDLDKLIEEKKVWKKGTWGWHLKRHPHDYQGIISMECSDYRMPSERTFA